MKFYQFTQNNSGGSFTVDNKLCHRIFIEAESASEATSKALDMGIYFDGVLDDIDCSCCGDRWYQIGEGDGMIFPYVYQSFDKENALEISKKYKCELVKIKNNKWGIEFPAIESYARYLADEFGWTTPDVRIYYACGAIASIDSDKVKDNRRQS